MNASLSLSANLVSVRGPWSASVKKDMEETSVRNQSALRYFNILQQPKKTFRKLSFENHHNPFPFRAATSNMVSALSPMSAGADLAMLDPHVMSALSTLVV